MEHNNNNNNNNKNTRPSWDEYFFQITQLVATRSTCLRRQVGAVIVQDKRILTTGYNGSPKNLNHCAKVGCLREQMQIPSGERHEICRAIHAEQNAILQAAQYGVPIKNATIYCTHQPCAICAKLIINSDINRIFVKEYYPDELSLSLLKEANFKKTETEQFTIFEKK